LNFFIIREECSHLFDGASERFRTNNGSKKMSTKWGPPDFLENVILFMLDFFIPNYKSVYWSYDFLQFAKKPLKNLRPNPTSLEPTVALIECIDN
jgi:hypothetical protein